MLKGGGFLSLSERSLRAKIAAHERWAREPDRSAATAPARQAYADRFIAAARALHPKATEEFILTAAGNLRSAAASRAARARWATKAGSGDA